MIRIAILDHNAYPLNNITSNLQQPRFIATTMLDEENLSAWLAKHGVDMLILPLPNKHQRSTTASVNEANSERFNGSWRLYSSQLELLAPSGKLIPLSHNECCVLKAAANANGKVISRKSLIEALGQEFWYYDERRLESLISRLRRKLASCAPEEFQIRGVKGQGYLFKVTLQVVET